MRSDPELEAALAAARERGRIRAREILDGCPPSAPMRQIEGSV